MSKKNISKNIKHKNQLGLYLKKNFKISYAGKPLITIITVTLNCEDLLERTIKSVLNLSYENIEFILVDGESIDGTLNVIKKYNNYIDFWISQKDKGIYDAMNKGAKKARGEAIFYLNAGDKLKHDKFVKLIKLLKK